MFTNGLRLVETRSGRKRQQKPLVRRLCVALSVIPQTQ